MDKRKEAIMRKLHKINDLIDSHGVEIQQKVWKEYEATHGDMTEEQLDDLIKEVTK